MAEQTVTSSFILGFMAGMCVAFLGGALAEAKGVENWKR